jgi:putative transposase
MMTLIHENRETVGVKFACEAFGVPESSYFRNISPVKIEDKPQLFEHHRALREEEQTEVLSVLNSDKYVDKAPAAVVACLLDEGKYLCSVGTMYRILRKNKASKERRDQRRHPDYVKPELIATGPNQVWTWDITKIRTGIKFKYHHLYVIIDMYSRYVVGWVIHDYEDSGLAVQLIEQTCEKQGIVPGQLTIHADRGAAMKSQSVAQLMADLDINKSHSRPYVSDDNPFSEAQFKTLKYHSSYPKIIATLDEAKLYMRGWFNWYNNEHRHSGIAMLKPVDVHTGKAEKVLGKRQKILDKAYLSHPERFPRGKPKVASLAKAVYINKPKEEKLPNKENGGKGSDESVS